MAGNSTVYADFHFMSLDAVANEANGLKTVVQNESNIQ